MTKTATKQARLLDLGTREFGEVWAQQRELCFSDDPARAHEIRRTEGRNSDRGARMNRDVRPRKLRRRM